MSRDHTTSGATAYGEPRARRAFRGPDVVTLLAGLVTLFVAAYLLSDGADWLVDVDLRWVIAGGAALTGVLMLAASLFPGRRAK